MKERRHATRPYYRKSAENDYLFSFGLTLIVGAMIGAVITIGVMS